MIADGTGLNATQPLDRFLGQLHNRKVPVHERAARYVSPANSKPTILHDNLLQLFRSPERVRIVTTNFDLHFEAAAKDVFGTLPSVYRAPALPLGGSFNGIVHVHGALPNVTELVLTDSDFGRAYLTQGWARRFLVEVFRSYTILFIGYTHSEVVMNYLARALPGAESDQRFALTDENGDWRHLGVTPILFRKGAGSEAYRDLHEGIYQLAERAKRGVLDWQTRIAELGGRKPPSDEDAAGEVEQALRELHTTRFLVNVARDVDWPQWMNARKHLDALFDDSLTLNDRDNLLAWWIAEHYSVAYPNEILRLLTVS